MPAKNTLKSFVENGYYHIYNRGVEKRTIFTNHLDYSTFLGYLKQYLSPPSPHSDQRTLVLNGKTYTVETRKPNNFHGKVTLLAYCLMPNHFHLLIKQTAKNNITSFMKSLCTRYTMYFNKSQQRVGRLFQGIYKAVLVETDAQLLHLTRYIHLNPLKLSPTARSLHQLLISQPSSYAEYCGKRITPWIDTTEVISFFNTHANHQNSYQSFVETDPTPPEEYLENTTLD